jgi:hypothetical protein
MEKLLPAYLSVLVAAIVAVIAFLQYRTARQQWRTANNHAVLDQFERRYAIYTAFREVIGSIVGSSHAAHDGFIKAAEAAERAKFLFDDDVVSYVDQLVRDVSDLSNIVRERNDETHGDDLKKNVQEERRLRDRIEKFRTEGTELFARYIRFPDKTADA